MLCQRLRSCTLNICSQREWVYCFYHVSISRVVCLCLHFFFFVLFSSSLLVHFLLVWVFIFFVYVNTSLQQSTCNSFLRIDLLCLWFFIGKTLQRLTKDRWIFIKKCYGLFDTLPLNIQLTYVDHYFKYAFGERSLVILL
jgi:hypothetical protein